MIERNASMWTVKVAGVALVALCGQVSADVTFDRVPVGNPGNAGEECAGVDGWSTGLCGAVSYSYAIEKREVTVEQYVEFLNAVAETDTNDLYNANMGSDARGGITQEGSSGSFTYSIKSDMGNKPVNYISFLNAMRFVNWLHNGQPTGAQSEGTTEAGVYTIVDGLSETRAADAKFFIPTENEWYKAAYHQLSSQGGPVGDYWLYPTASDSEPAIANADSAGNISNPGSNVANYSHGADWNSQDGNLTTVGSAGAASESYYGTSDQGGNVYEWTETLGRNNSERGTVGGSFDALQDALQSRRDGLPPSLAVPELGFRVAHPLPEIPAVSEWGLAIMMMILFTAGTLLLRRADVA